MKFSLLYEMETPRPWHALSEYNVYWEALAQIEVADRLGFDYVWTVEHHFLEEYSHSSAPEVFYGAVTQRTHNIRIGHGVRLLPFRFNHPIKVAEAAAVLDIMSNGRADIGTGRSTTSQELDGFGVSYETSREEWAEALEIIVKAWTEEVMEYNGKLIQVPSRRVVPKPIQRPHPPMWMACVAPESYEIAGEKGLGVLSFAMNWDAVQKSMADYRAACSRRLSPVPKVITEQFAGLCVVHVCETREEEAIALDGARWFMSHVADLFRPMMTRNKLYTYEYLRHLFALDSEPRDLSDAELKQHHMVVVGTPDEVIRKLQTFRDGGMDQVICFKQAGRIPNANILKSLNLMGRHVLPHFRTERSAAALALETGDGR
jgi:alkanesulfonate monooxygenase SsuD/methylene tetrahydromethanopterin reductase-like flavin-dependent oxidoreductase (luciferase family)